MTANEARSFDRVSLGNVVSLLTQVEGRKEDGQHPADCRCEPYCDFFTIRRWNAQGFHVVKGSRSFRIPVVVTKESEPTADTNQDTTDTDKKPKDTKLLRTACVFCRCQVETSRKAAQSPAESAVSA